MVKRSRAADLNDAVEELLDLSRHVHHAVASVAARHDLTPQQFELLRMLHRPVSMRAFAQELCCDPSNVTGLVSRLERMGLAERIPDPTDRRVRLLSLTPKGRRLREMLNREIVRELSTDLPIGLQPGSIGS
jgi:DNA-binding MarR family transcriptional regulator